MPVTPTELDALRSEVQTWYTDTCDIYRPTITEDAYGGEDETASTLLYSTVPCFLESTPGRDQIAPLIAALREAHIFVVYLPATDDVQIGDDLVITSRDDLRLRVQAVMNPETLDIELIVAASTLGEQ